MPVTSIVNLVDRILQIDLQIIIMIIRDHDGKQKMTIVGTRNLQPKDLIYMKVEEEEKVKVKLTKVL